MVESCNDQDPHMITSSERRPPHDDCQELKALEEAMWPLIGKCDSLRQIRLPGDLVSQIKGVVESYSVRLRARPLCKRVWTSYGIMMHMQQFMTQQELL